MWNFIAEVAAMIGVIILLLIAHNLLNSLAIWILNKLENKKE